MKAGIWDYIRAAFVARPLGMVVPPNWIGLGFVAFLSLLNPGFLLLGAGLELAYLYLMVTSPRFQRFVDAERLQGVQQQWQSRLNAILSRLGEADRGRYRALEQRCRSILELQGSDDSAGLRAQGEGLGRLLWIYVKLLFTRQSINRVRGESAAPNGDRATLEARIARLQERLKDEKISDELRRSLGGQVEILQQRQQKQQEADQKRAFLESELARIQDQVELIREQAVLAADPETISQRIDQIAATLGGTTQWIREQQQIYGQVEDLMAEPPPVAMPAKTEETQ
jgi:chromosome segregation ATPase